MRFNSYDFAIFFAALLPAYWLLHKRRARAERPPFGCGVLLLRVLEPEVPRACSSSRRVVDFACGSLGRSGRGPRSAAEPSSQCQHGRSTWACSAISSITTSSRKACRRAARAQGCSIPLRHLEVVLPIGISFYTFQSMSYVIDVYRRELKPTRNLVQFAIFVSFFPHLVAGPIMRPTSLLPQVAYAAAVSTCSNSTKASYLIFWGLVKKVVVADNLALVVNDLFGELGASTAVCASLALYAFAFQIYGDFSGYTNMARGVAKCLGFELPLNFNLPYFATSPQDFWNRWHISLSHWLRDYLYIPLGGSRRGTAADLPQPDADDGPGRPLAWRSSGRSWSGASTREFCWFCTGWPRHGSSGSARRYGRSRVLDRPAHRRHVSSGLSRLVDLPRRFAGASRGNVSGDRAAAGDPGRTYLVPRWHSRSSRFVSSSSFNTPPAILTSSAVPPGMSAACFTPAVFMRSCWSASSAANSSSTFSFESPAQLLSRFVDEVA